MRTIGLQVTFEALCAMRRASEHDGNTLANDARRQPDGLWEISVDEEVLENIARSAAPGESASDTIIRLVHFYCGGRLN